MGTQDKRFRAIANLNSTEFTRIQLQTTIDNSTSIENCKRFCQFATPYELAKEIISYGLKLQAEKEISFLKPVISPGAFYSALLSECGKQFKCIKSATGIEVDNDFFIAAHKLWRDTGINLVSRYFTEIDCFEKINLLINNPPYVRHHHINKDKKRKNFCYDKKRQGDLILD